MRRTMSRIMRAGERFGRRATPSAERRDTAERGSVTVFVALLIPILSLMIFLVLNIGQLVFERIRLQNTADYCALSAAAVQAAGLNEIAELNWWSENWVLNTARIILALTPATPWDNHGISKQATGFFTDVFKNIRDYQDDANKYYARKALSIAKAVKKANYDDKGITNVNIKSINPKSTFSNPGKMMEYKELTETLSSVYLSSHSHHPACSYWVSSRWNDSSAGDKKHMSMYFMGWSAESTCGGGVGTDMVRYKYKIEKKKTPMTYSAFKLTQESHDFILAGSVFGKMDKLTAYAAAMPTKGDIKKGDPDYKAILVRLKDLNPKPDVSDLDKVLH